MQFAGALGADSRVPGFPLPPLGLREAPGRSEPPLAAVEDATSVHESHRAQALHRALERLGGHEAGRLGLDLAQAEDRPRWLVAARLASERDREEVCRAAFRALDGALGTRPADLVAAGPGAVASVLAGAGIRRPELVAGSLVRSAAALLERHAGDLEALARGCDGLEELGGRLAALGPGLGAATVLRFLRPLRRAWDPARAVPLAETARVAAAHLGLVAEGEDPESAAGSLAAACAGCAPELDVVDVEAALERLGARACRAGRTDRCPLDDACPARASGLE